jgi:hypothetical protein
LAALVVLEVVIVATLGGFVWHALQSGRDRVTVAMPPDDVPPPITGRGATPLPRTTGPLPRSTGTVPATARPASPAGGSAAAARGSPGTPDLNRVNREQAAWEVAQWQLIRTFEQAARAYLDRVVLPAVERAGDRR